MNYLQWTEQDWLPRYQLLIGLWVDGWDGFNRFSWLMGGMECTFGKFFNDWIKWAVSSICVFCLDACLLVSR